MSRIFISYRRDDSQHAVDRLHAVLKGHVADPASDIFIDIDNIPFGIDFVDYIDEKVGACEIMLVVIGKNWLDAKNPQTGRSRLEDAGDFVRIEVASALRRQIRVVPVLLDDADVPAEPALPEDLKALARRNGTRIQRLTFEQDVARLVKGLDLQGKRAAAQTAPPAPRAPQAAVGFAEMSEEDAGRGGADVAMIKFVASEHGDQFRQAFFLRRNVRLKIGRAPSNDVVVLSRIASRFHCGVSAEPEGVFLEDYHSTNGTALNGKRLSAGERVILSDGDAISLAGYELRVQLFGVER